MLALTIAYLTIGAIMALIAAGMGGRVSAAELVMVGLLGPLALVAVLAIAGASRRRRVT